jgi:hypothetical protein
MPTVAWIVNEAFGNRYLVHDLQRDFKWGRERVRSLLASVIAHHPIGAVVVVKRLLESPPRQTQTITRSGTRGNDAVHVLDGQQRLISLLAGFRGPRKEGGRDSDWYNDRVNAYFWCLDLESWVNELAARKQRDPQDVMPIERAIRAMRLRQDGISLKSKNGKPLSIKYMSNSLLESARKRASFRLPLWYLLQQGYENRSAAGEFSEFLEHARQAFLDSERADAFSIVRSQLELVGRYQVPVITVRPCTAIRAAQMFDRMNRKGQPLDSADLVCSQLFIHDSSLREHMRTLCQRCSSPPFTAWPLRQLYEDDVLRVALCAGARSSAAIDFDPVKLLKVVRKPDGVRSIRNGFDSLSRTLAHGSEILGECGVASRRHWPIPAICQALLAAVGRHSDTMGFGGANRMAAGHWRRRLVRWWWCENLRQIPMLRRPDLSSVFADLEGWILAARELPDIPTFTSAGLREHMLGPRRTGIARSGSSLSLLFECFLRMIDLEDFASGKQLDSKNLELDLHHIFPKAWARDNGLGDVDCLANLTLLTRDTNRNLIKSKGPESFFCELARENAAAGGTGSEVEADLDRVLDGHGVSRALCSVHRYREFLEYRMDWADRRLRKSVSGLPSSSAGSPV